MTSNRDSCFMAGIDEREEFDLTSSSNSPDKKLNSRTRPS